MYNKNLNNKIILAKVICFIHSFLLDQQSSLSLLISSQFHCWHRGLAGSWCPLIYLIAGYSQTDPSNSHLLSGMSSVRRFYLIHLLHKWSGKPSQFPGQLNCSFGSPRQFYFYVETFSYLHRSFTCCNMHVCKSAHVCVHKCVCVHMCMYVFCHKIKFWTKKTKYKRHSNVSHWDP